MNGITITHEHLMIAVALIPELAIGYLIFHKRKKIWKHKRNIRNVAIILVTIAACVITGRNQLYNYNNKEANLKKEEQRQFQLATAEEQQQILLKQEKAKEAEKKAKLEVQEKEREKLPGKWWNLRQALKKCSFWEAKMAAIEGFPQHYSVDSVESLPVTGFNLILDEINRKDDASGASAERIDRAKIALQPYLIPFEIEIKPTEVKPWNGPEVTVVLQEN